jgi:RNA polymerase sigma factor for flagellar operon FliA
VATYIRKTSDPLDLFREYRRTGDVAVRNRLIERYLYVVDGIAKNFQAKMPRDVQMGDIISAGVFGLIQAISVFDPERGFAFVTYAGKRIKGSILDWAREQDFVPRLARDRSKKLDAAITELRTETGKTPTRKQVAKKLGISGSDFDQFERSATVRRIGSLSDVLDADMKEVTRAELLIDEKAVNPADDPNHTALRDLMLKHFKLSDALLVRLLFVEGLPMIEIGPMLGTTEGMVFHRRRHIFNRLKNMYGSRLYEMLTGRAA